MLSTSSRGRQLLRAKRPVQAGVPWAMKTDLGTMFGLPPPFSRQSFLLRIWIQVAAFGWGEEDGL